MRKTLAIILTAAVILSLTGTMVSAHPKAIAEKTFELKVETIFVRESSVAGTSYTIEYTNPQTSSDDVYKIYPLTHSEQKGGFAVLKADVSSIKQASDFTLKLSFATSSTKNSVLGIYCADYEAGESLFTSLKPGEIKTNVTKPDVYNTASDTMIYKYTTEAKSNVEATLSGNDYLILKNHVADAIKNGSDAVYFLVAVTKGDYFYLYNSLSGDNAPSLTVKGSSISSEIVSTEDGYIYKVGGLDAYADSVMVVVAAYDGTDTLIKVATSPITATAAEKTVDVCIACLGADSLKAYILNANTLEPLTYMETQGLPA